MTKTSILPPREYSDPEEERLARALDDMASKMLAVVDAACRLRSAPPETKRQRAMMKTNLEEAAQKGMNALSYSKSDQKGA